MRVPLLPAALLTVALTAAGCASSPDPQDPEAGTESTPVVWVAAEGDDALTLIDATTGDVLTTLYDVSAPHNVQATPDGTGVWVTHADGVAQVDAARLDVKASAESGAHPAHVVAGPDGSVWVTAAEDGTVYAHNADLSSATRHVVGGAPHGMRMAPDGSFAAVANTGMGLVDLIDLSDHAASGHDEKTVRSLPVGPLPIQVAVSADSSTVFASVAGTREVVAVSVESGQITGRVSLPSAPAQVWATRSGLLLTANQGTEDEPGKTVTVIDAGTMEVIGKVKTGAGPHGLVVDEDETYAWVTNSFDDTVSMVDLKTLKTVRTIPVGTAPNGITITTGTFADDPAAAVPLGLSTDDTGSGHDHEAEDAHGEEGSHPKSHRQPTPVPDHSSHAH